MTNELLIQIGALILSGLPISVFAVLQINKIFGARNAKLAETTVICSELTGILTKKTLIPKTLLIDKEVIRISHKTDLIEIQNLDSKDEIKVEKHYLKTNESVHLAAIATHFCKYEKLQDLEEVISKFFLECGFNKIKIANDYEQIQEIPSTENKKISTSVIIKNNSKEIFSFTKGNPLKVLEKCTRIMMNGKKEDLTKNLRNNLRNKIKKLNEHGQKLIAFAYKGLPLKRLDNYTEQFAEGDLIFIGLVGLAHPVNMELKESVDIAKKSGLKIYITTVSKSKQAVYAAMQLGMINPRYFEVITSADIETTHEKKLKVMLSNTEKDFVFAELKAEDKIKIMETLKELDNTIAVASKKSDKSIKEIIDGIRNERINKINRRKYLQHAFAFKLGEFLLVLTTIILSTPLPLSILAILSIDIFINTILELALKKDPVKVDVMKKDLKLLETKLNKKRLVINGLAIYIISIGVYLFSLVRYGWSLGENMSTKEAVIMKTSASIFVLLSLIQIFNALNFKSMKISIFSKKTFKNYYLILTAVIAVLITYLLTISPEIQKTLALAPLSAIEWQIAIFAAIGIVLVEEIAKFIKRNYFKNEIESSKK